MKTREQLKALEEAFTVCSFVCGEELAQLAAATGLTAGQVKKWFEHQRRKLRQEYAARQEPVPVWLEARTSDMPTRKSVAVAPAAASAASAPPKPKRAPRKKTPTTGAAAANQKPNIKSKIQKIKSSVLAPEQLAELNAALDEFTSQHTRLPEQPHPDEETMAALVEATGLELELIALWFERKVDRMRRLAEQQAEMGEDVETFKTGQKHLTAEQRGILEGAFLMATYPTQDTIAMLSTKTEIPVTRICNWFNQRRAKARRMSELGDERPTRPDRFPPATLAALEAAFAEKPYLDHDEKIEMAERLGLEVKQIKIYWTSARARYRQQGIHLEPPAMWCSSRARRLAAGNKRLLSEVDEGNSSRDGDAGDDDYEDSCMAVEYAANTSGEEDSTSTSEEEEEVAQPPRKVRRVTGPPPLALPLVVSMPQLPQLPVLPTAMLAPPVPMPALMTPTEGPFMTPQFAPFTPMGFGAGTGGMMLGEPTPFHLSTPAMPVAVAAGWLMTSPSVEHHHQQQQHPAPSMMSLNTPILPPPHSFILESDLTGLCDDELSGFPYS